MLRAVVLCVLVVLGLSSLAVAVGVAIAKCTHTCQFSTLSLTLHSTQRTQNPKPQK